MGKPFFVIFASALLIGAPELCAARDGARAQLPQAVDSYYRDAEATLQRVGAQKPNTRRAKSVILFVGDGMGISTVTAARIFEGQMRGVDGESNVLAFEAFPYVALAKTYAHDAQVSDSAPTATAMIAGVKTRNDIIGLDQRARLNDCAGSKDMHVTTLWEIAEQAGLATGVVTTARLTHATPAATYAHSASRDWESDADMPPEARAQGCADIARQLIETRFGDGLEIALGGGREKFLPRDAVDPADRKMRGARQDGRDLIKAWQDRYGPEAAYVSSADQLAAVDPTRTMHVLGLFAPSHMAYESERAASSPSEPSLADMTTKAIDVLSQNRKGFILMVEAGRIDHGSHEGKASLTLSETMALNEAVKAALAKVSAKDTLILVTADHSHTLTIGGYVKRNNPILGLAVDVTGKLERADDGLPYTTLSFANGPGGFIKGKRADLSRADTAAPGFVQQALVPLRGETHAGEDVAIYAIGPSAHLFRGTVEQNYIFHVMAHALRLDARTAKASQ
jgi:alkaline phosphatase